MQLNAIFRLKKYMSQKQLKIAFNSFVYLNFNTTPWRGTLVLINLLKKLTTYISVLNVLQKSLIRRIKTLAIEIFKTVNELKPNFMKTIITSKQILEFNLWIY